MAHSHKQGHHLHHDDGGHHHHDSGNILVKLAMALQLPGFTHDHSHADLAADRAHPVATPRPAHATLAAMRDLTS